MPLLKPGETYSPELLTAMQVLARVYEKIVVTFVSLEGTFGPELIERLSKEWKMPPNVMFIGSPGNRLSYQLADLGDFWLLS